MAVTSDQLKWLPAGSEMPPDSKTKFTSFGCSQDSLPAFTSEAIASRYPDIVLAKLRPGQAIELEAHAVKGIGKTHAKWSPVATAKYRMLPEVVLLEDIEGDLADELVRTCPVNVFDIEDMGPGERRATVARPRDCTLCRECVRGDRWDKRVQLRRVKEHFICKPSPSCSAHIFLSSLKDSLTIHVLTVCCPAHDKVGLSDCDLW
jgi:DNA-directed RNA polymerase I and III subunit RPAC1